jgi:alkaline phosphatase D
MRHCVFLFAFFLLLGKNAFPQQLKAGPMLGKVGQTSAWLWAWADAGDELEVHVGEKRFRSQADAEGFFRLEIAGLMPDKQYTYRLKLNGTALGESYTFHTFPDSAVFDFDMALGSCAYITDSSVGEIEAPGKIPFGAQYQMFDTIANRRPDVMFWLGDNIYLRDGEWNTREGVLYRYLHARQHPGYARLLATGSHIAIWDDHDYGPNDSDRLYQGKDMTRDVFLKQWLNPEPASDSGIYTTWRMGDVELFLLDDRSFRPRNAKGSMFGEAQQRWLIERLKASTATFKIVASGSQLLSTQSLGEAYWARSQQYLKDFLDSLAVHRIEGLFFVSGDVHVTEISRYDLAGGYALYDFTFSPLTSLPNPIPVKNYRRVKKSYFRKRNFGWISFRGQGINRHMVIKALNRKGKTLWEHRVYAAELVYDD